eukprot:Tamp_11354.p2 GENE.Tamp_11354~~Tamp_11354.p2  ORF type:complete len:137 (+),score=1.43 Tamp_11354:571-981(+)
MDSAHCERLQPVSIPAHVHVSSAESIDSVGMPELAVPRTARCVELKAGLLQADTHTPLDAFRIDWDPSRPGEPAQHKVESIASELRAHAPGIRTVMECRFSLCITQRRRTPRSCAVHVNFSKRCAIVLGAVFSLQL